MIRALVSELVRDAGTAKLPAAVSTGLVISLLVVAVQTSIASIVFAGPLAPFVSVGTGAALFGASALCLVTALFGNYPGTVSVPQFPVAAVLVTVSAAVSARMADASVDSLGATMLVVLCVSTLATGLCFSLIGWLRLSRLFRFMPYPLVGGFLAGLGWVLSVSGIKMASGIDVSWHNLPLLLDPYSVLHWGPSVAYAALMFAVSSRSSHFLIIPASIAIGTGLYWAALFALGISGEEARSEGFLFVGLPEGPTWPSLGPDLPDLVDWATVASQVPGILSVVLIAVMAIVLNAGALEAATDSRLDMDREFRAEGAGCLAAGMGPSVPGCNVIQLTLTSRSTGADTRFTGVVIALSLACVLVFGGGLMAALPMPVLGGLVLYIGLGLIRNWVLSIRKSIPAADYAIVLAVSLVIVVFGFVQGVAVGLAAAVVFFVLHFSRVDVIADAFDGRMRRSARRRSAVHRAILREQGSRIRAYRLRGYVIFGNAAPMGERVTEALKREPRPLCLLLDFAGVSGFDVSAANVISRCVRAASLQETQVVISGISARVRGVLQRALRESERESLAFVDGLNEGLERCEDLAIADWTASRAGSADARGALFHSSIDDAERQMEAQARFEDLVDRLDSWLEERTYAPGETVVARSEAPEGMHLVLEGRIAALDPDSGKRIDEYEFGDVLAPESSLGTLSARLDLAAGESSRTAVLTPDRRKSLERVNPALALELDRYVIETVAKRLAGLTPRADEDRTGAGSGA